ncbi:cytolethal distending toxin subunit B family protein [Avibacterium paragallinarum]|uniref:Cytolethal distending toxin protein B n=3 Tax=Avibacterium paragallinarum TaxID=728 RepID=W6HYF0_AVIPA|nr:cytolethal distending toxin subunit B family protein [Avibacterium paragallinarum]AHJ58631.1 cytolethal distending toxin protein B [Avibacterium paragallinarum 221]AHJ58637.1 cytolethal distending toxin protein B [Avibacterium paragallinarum]AHJ58640.1 cytolethal distending toxin protein B [Avibacterium paragallinarum]AHJ58643.1 cytolethal distending toxin protein B [Avibacterium paragallinarum]AHJ58646.1 cytolethal distending toxin protein B [Avibacterium paragallinarum]
MLKRIMLCLGFLLYVIQANANLEDFKVATWNLQGSSAANENKWNVSVRQLITGEGAADILAVQEAGVLPSSAMITERMVQPVGVGIPIHEYTWNLGTSSRPDNVFIYYSRVDVGANRVNLAIVSRIRADEVIVIPPPTVISRPIIGIRIGNDAFFSIHALASRGADSTAIVRAVFDYFNTRPEQRNTNWMIVGDFNRVPSNLQRSLETSEPGVARHINIIAPTTPTQQSGGTLDYGIVGNSGSFIGTAIIASILFGQIRSQLLSDHRPVGFFVPR